MKWLKNKLGFTLVELFIILAIAGILAAMLLPYVMEYSSGGDMPRVSNSGEVSW